jgi:hypothetical protein
MPFVQRRSLMAQRAALRELEAEAATYVAVSA